MMQAIRIAIMLDNHPGNRKDLRIVRDLRDRLDLSDEKIQRLTRPVQGGVVIAEEVKEMPAFGIQVAPEEARKLLEILDGQTLLARDLQWVEPLAKSLSEITA